MSAKISGVMLTMVAMSARADWPQPKDLPSRAERPDALAMFDGTKVTTKEQWHSKRKPEIKELFQHYMYGAWPEAPTNLTSEVLHEDKNAFGGKGTLREVEILFNVYGKKHPLPIYLMIAIPNDRKSPVPVFVGPNFGGNHLYSTDPNIRVPDAWMYPKYPGVKDNRATDEGRGPFQVVLRQVDLARENRVRRVLSLDGDGQHVREHGPLVRRQSTA